MYYFFTKRAVKKLKRNNYQEKVGNDSSLSFKGITTVNDFIKVLTALPRFVTQLALPDTLSWFSTTKIQKILRHIPKTVHEVDFSRFYFDTMTLDLGVLSPSIKKVSLNTIVEFTEGGGMINYDCFHRNPHSYTRNFIRCIASLPSSVQCLSLRGQALGKWSNDALLGLADVIPPTIEVLDLSETGLGLCQTDCLAPFFSALKVSELDLSGNRIVPGHTGFLRRQRTVQEVIKILSAFPARLETLYAYKTFLDYKAPVDSQEIHAILKALPSGVRTLKLFIPEEDFPTARDILPPSVRTLVGASNFRAARQVCRKWMSVKTFVQLDSEEIMQRFLDADTVCLSGQPVFASRQEHEQCHHRIVERLPLLSCSELCIPNFEFWQLPTEYCASFFEALHPNVITLNLSDNTSLAKNSENLLALIRSIPETVLRLHLDNIELGSRLSTRELIALFQEIPKHLHLSLNQNDLFRARTRQESQEILSAIRQGRAMTADTLLDHNGGESDANRALPVLREAVEKGSLLLEMASEILSFLVPRHVNSQKMILEEPEELNTLRAASGCCTIL